jgi:hypothetical protein
MEKAKRNNSERRINVNMKSGDARNLYRFINNVLNDVVYDVDADRYVMNGGNSSKSIDREFYNTLCEVTEGLSAVIAANRSVATI